MRSEPEAAEPQAPAPPGPEEIVAEIRGQVADGTPLVGSLATRFHRAVHAMDPAGTEDSLAVLPGNRGVHLYDSLLTWAPIVSKERVLDIGCGSGGATRAAARIVGPEGMVVGLDLVPECVETARARTPEEMPVLFRPGDAQMMASVPDRTFDCVVASMMLEEVADLPRLLATTQSKVRSGTEAIICASPGRALRGQRHRVRPAP